MENIAACLPKCDAQQLAHLRTLSGLQLCDSEELLWLRCESPSDTVVTAIQSLRTATVFRVLESRELCPLGKRLPAGYLPESGWKPLVDWYGVELPRAGFAGEVPPGVDIQLVRGGSTQEPSLLLTGKNEWLAFGRVAPKIRLERLRFAVSDEEDVLIRGTPLPPIPGERFYESHGIAVPCGWTWEPAIDADVLRSVFGIQSPQLVIWRDGHPPEVLDDDNFVQATRSAIRMSTEAVSHHG